MQANKNFVLGIMLWKILMWNIIGLTLMKGSVNAELTKPFFGMTRFGYAVCHANREIHFSIPCKY